MLHLYSTCSEWGVEKALIEMLNAFDYEKYNVTLWLRNKSGEWTTQVNDNVTIRCWGDENSREIFNRQLKNKQYIAAAKSIYNKLKCRYWKNQWDMNEFYATKSLPKLNASYDCVIAYQVMSTAVVANVLYRLQSDKKILWVHGRNLRQPEKNLFWDKIYTQFDCIFCVSEACCRDFYF